MSDIVIKLRTIYTKDYPDGMHSPLELMKEAADEIERLRGELQAREQAIHIVLDECSKAAGSEEGLCLAELPQAIRNAALEEAAKVLDGMTTAAVAGYILMEAAQRIRNLRKRDDG